ncbi:MAG: amidohydrolase [Chloroflexi bacterium]|nr:amidohydrolase [Chloroflexota bacterium]
MTGKQDILTWLENHQPDYTEMSDHIWEYAELPWHEFKSSKLQADYLASKGFRITWDLAGINTAFCAEWGSGSPVIGFAGEYDALKGLSQKNQPVQEPLVPGAPGHGCGHNLLGTGCLAATEATKTWLEANHKQGTVRYYGCPAEEGGAAKAFMARAGVFDDLDAAFNFHPGSLNSPTKGSCVGVNHLRFRFHGRAAHAGGSPHLGRSALDAVELMNVGVNYLREHVPEYVRLHYVITHGGDLPNVVPAEAEVWYYIRAYKPEDMEDVTNRVRKIAEGAALMTETRMEECFDNSTAAILNNHTLADLLYENMKVIGPIQFTGEEFAYAQSINDAFPAENVNDYYEELKNKHLPAEVLQILKNAKGQPLIGGNICATDEGMVRTGSTDVGDLSRVTPLSMLYTACHATGAPGHSWANVATGAMSIGHKGMMHAAKIMALSAIDLFSDESILQTARKEFLKATEGVPYRSSMPASVQPPQFHNPERFPE